MNQNSNIQERKVHEKIYVKVSAGFDATGYMQPIAITWADGRIFPIDEIRSFRPADNMNTQSSPFGRSDCYSVVIHGKDKHLFFERNYDISQHTIGRWFVENIS